MSDDNYIQGSYGISISILLIVLLIVTFYVFYLLYTVYKIEKEYIDPKYCPPQINGYLVTPATTGILKSNCGTNKSELCQFSINILFDSIAKCNDLGSNCINFTFDGQNMNVVDERNLIGSDQGTNLYTKTSYII
jgi:hypothetical protein